MTSEISTKPIILNFGKLKGQELNYNLARENDNYLRYISISDKFMDSKPEVKAFLNKYFNETPYILDFGKYKGRTLSQVYNDDDNYYKWLKQKCNNDVVKHEILKLENQVNIIA